MTCVIFGDCFANAKCNRSFLQNALDEWDVEAVVAQAAAGNDCEYVIAAALKRMVEGLHVSSVARGIVCDV